MTIDAYCHTLCYALGLRSRDVAEIGGFSERFARDLVNGRRNWPDDMKQLLRDIDDDIDVIADVLVDTYKDEETATLVVFRKTKTLRNHFPDWPGRGAAKGGFSGPHSVAVMTAFDVLTEKGVDVSVRFFEEVVN